MLGSYTILSALKYAGFAITGFAAVWGLISKTSYEDESGRKHLTQAGKIAIATAALSALVGMIAFGFESLQRDQSQRDAARDNVLTQAASDRKEAAQQRRHDQELRQSANDVERARFLALRAMAQQAAGDARLGRRLAENNGRVLSGFSATLYQIQRVSQPIHRLIIEMTSVIPLKGVRNDGYVRRLLAAPSTTDRADLAEKGLKIERRTDGAGAFWTALEVSEGSSLFPKAADESQWFELATGRMRFSFFADGFRVIPHIRGEGPHDTSVFDIFDKNANMKEITRRSPPINPNDPDITFEVRPNQTTILYNTLNRYLTFTYTFELNWSAAEGTGRVISQIDLDHASLLIAPADFARIYLPDAERFKIPNVERICRVDVNTGLRRLERRKFRRFRNAGEMDVVINNLASYRAPAIYEDQCDLEPDER